MNRIEVRVTDELYDLVVDESLATGLSLSEVLAKCFAEHKGRDESTWRLEKGRPGPKPQRRNPIPIKSRNGKRVPA